MSKRAPERDCGDKKQRPRLASLVVEAVKCDGLQKLCQSLEPLVRRVVGEEIERALGKFRLELAETRISAAAAVAAIAPAPAAAAASRATSSEESLGSLRLQFRNKVAISLFTGGRIEGEHGSPISILLQDAETGHILAHGPEALLKLEIVVLDGDFSADDEEYWTQEEFSSHEVRERDGKGPLLTGDTSVVLKDGVGTLGELSFSDNSSWIRSRKFRLGAKVSSASSYQGQRIREAKSDAFVVKDHRGELYKKHYPPELHDEVWRLDKIGKDGAFHRRLYKAGARTVEDFLRLAVMDPQRLRNILGSGMSNKMWEGTMEHAKTCVLSQKLYVYYADERQNVGIIFNTIYQLMGLISDTRYLSADSLSESEKVYVDKLVKVAYENWGRVVEYEGEPIEELREVHHQMVRQNEELQGQEQQNLNNNTIVVRPTSTPSVPSTPLIASMLQPWSPVVATTPSSEWLFYKEMRSPAASCSDEMLAMVTEEEMRAKGLEFLENEEINRQMKQLLLMLAGAGGSSSSSRHHAAKVRGRWLKIRAAFTWGIYIRNIAAARRALKTRTIFTL